MSWLSSLGSWAGKVFSPGGVGTSVINATGQIAGSIAAGKTTTNTGGVMAPYSPYSVPPNPYQTGYNTGLSPAVSQNSDLLMYGGLALGAIVLLKMAKVF